MKAEQTPRPLPFRLDAMVMVCKACGKRSSGPGRDARPKKVAQEMKQAGKEAGLKTRVVLTSCMGLCPKRATAVAVVTDKAPPAQFAIESLEQVPSALPHPA